MDYSLITDMPTPCYFVDESLLIRNLELLNSVRGLSGCKILLAQKGFSMYSLYPLISQYLDGTTASSLFEAKLGREHMPGEVHIYAPAYAEKDMDEIFTLCDHIVFNSPAQLEHFYPRRMNSKRKPECGIRINPEYSEIETEIYNPCAAYSRLGCSLADLEQADFTKIDGLHFHTLCEQNADTLARTLKVVEDRFGNFLHKIKWMNMGGGHHITRADYDIELLVNCVRRVRDKYAIEVYLEPGEAVVLNTGFLYASVLDVVHNAMDIAILDTSAACHMPDVLEMPYRPQIIDAELPGHHPYTYRLAGPTCLAGDIIGDYSFPLPLNRGDKLFFCDMAHYTMVKNNMFNGINLPSIAVLNTAGELRIIRQFGYDDYVSRLS